MFHPHVAEQIHLLEHAGVNCYIVQDGPHVMLVDAGLPRMWNKLMTALKEVDISPADITALVLTHGHFDHLGCAVRLEQEYGVPAYIHSADSYIATHPYRYKHERSRLWYPVRHPGCIPVLSKMAAAGALQVKGLRSFKTLHEETTGDLPGQPQLIHTPGHTDGHCALHFAGRGAIITGDALVTLDPYTGRRGPHIVSAAATADTTTAMESLTSLAATGADIVLPGHGTPFRGGIENAVKQARHHKAT